LMAQFDYYANTDKDTNSTYPFIVDVQDALLDGLNSRVVIPLTPLSNFEKIAQKIYARKLPLMVRNTRCLPIKWQA
jgi:hypothetical protein